MSDQLAFAVTSLDASLLTCPRCGRAVHPLHELAETAAVALHALQARRLVVPDVVPDALKLLSRDLACHDGACERQP